MDDRKRLEELRALIAEIDRDILRTIERRARVAQDIAKLRTGTSKFAPTADGQHMQALEEAVTPPFPVSAVRPIFTAIDSACRMFEVAPKVAFVGEESGPGQLAAQAHFGAGADLRRAESVSAALDDVARSKADYAVVPYESLNDGPIFSTIQAIAAADLKIVGEREATRRVASTGEEEVRVRYGVISRLPAPRSGADATALLLSLRERPGALHDVLQHFKERSCNLRRIQSRPLPGEGWEYLFYIEVSGHMTDRPLVAALEGVKAEVKTLKILGSFPLEYPEKEPVSLPAPGFAEE